jgi:glycosyltransferase involved in cell wall biosynthesis
LNILIISKYASSKEVGFESRIFAISRELAKSGHLVSIITSDSNHFANYPKFKKIYNTESVSNINLLCIRTIKYVKTYSLKRVLSWIDFEIKLFFLPKKFISNPNVIIISSLSLITILNGIKLATKLNSKLVFEIRDIWPLTITAEGSFSKYNPLVFILSLIEKFGYKKSDLVIGTMPNLRSHVYNVTKLKNIRCECIPFGINSIENIDKVESFDFRENFQIPKDKFIVGYAGSIGITNALDAFVESSKMLQKDNRFLFVVLGSGDLRDKFVKQTEGYENIIFIPKVPREMVASFLAICDVLYFSSLKSEIWEYGWSPNKIIDYMMARKPILASYSGYQSMINEADCGFFVESENAIEIKNKLLHLIEIPKENLNVIGNRGYEWLLKNRTWKKLADDYIGFINSL